jgi:glycerol-3-phosphate acyltransferase PlsY
MKPCRAGASIAAAFLAGALPTARIVARLAGVRLDEVGDHKMGAANVRHTVGLKPAVAVALVDFAKGYLPATLGRRAGASPPVVAAMTTAPVLGHILYAKGRGAATSVGAGLATDAPAMVLSGMGIVAGTVAGKHAEAVVIGGLGFAPASYALHHDKARSSLGFVLWLILIGARLRGSAGSPWPPPKNVLWSRFWRDRDA